MAKTRPIAVVVWDDAHGSVNKDVTPEDVDHKPMVMTTMGWVLRDDERGVTLAMERFAEEGKDYYRGTTFIPKGMIRSVTLFNLARVRKGKVENLETPLKPAGGAEPKMRLR